MSDLDTERMETNEDSDDSSEPELIDLTDEIEETKKLIDEDGANLAHSNKLLELYYKNGDIQELADYRDEFVKTCALNKTNWLNWIKTVRDELTVDEVENMFDRAVADSNCADIWQERIYYGISRGISVARQKCEDALSSIGTRYFDGGIIWMLYLSLEKSHFDSIQDETEKEAQAKQLVSIVKRAIKVPTDLIDDIYEESRQIFEYLNEPVDELEKVHEKTKKEALKLQEFENLISNDETKADGFNKWLEYEKKASNPSRIQMVYERVIDAYEYDEYVWSDYGIWCEQSLKLNEITRNVYERAIRHCPYSCVLFEQALLAMERAQVPDGRIDEIWEYAKNNVISTETDGISLYRTYAYQLRRRIAKSDDRDYKKVAEIFDEGAARLKEWFGNRWDPEAKYRRMWASFNARHMKQMEKAREIWKDVLSSGFGNNAAKWIEAAQLERECGAFENVRKLYNLALNSVAENVMDVYESYLQFEREEGELKDLDVALAKINAQVARRAARPAKKEKTKRQVNEPKVVAAKKRKEEDHDKKANAKEQTIQENQEHKTEEVTRDVEEAKRTVFVSNLDYGTTEEQIRQVLDGVECVRFSKRAKSDDLHRGFGYVVLSGVEMTKQALAKDRVLVNGRPMFISENNPEKRVGFKFSTKMEKSKLFVRNVHFKATEEEIQNVFAKFGDIKSVRIVRHKNGLPKGVAYVEFDSDASAAKALEEKIEIRGRELTVAISDPPAKQKNGGDGLKKNEDENQVETRQPKKGVLAFVPRAAKAKVQTKTAALNSSSSTTPSVESEFAKPAKKMTNDMFRQFLNK